jgi:hypothetical protein
MKWLRLPLLFVAAHTVLLLLTLLAIHLSESSHNPDSTIGFAMAMLTFHLLDFPIALLWQSCSCEFFESGGLWAVALLFGALGNAMWFSLGVLVHFGISWVQRGSQAGEIRRLRPTERED